MANFEIRDTSPVPLVITKCALHSPELLGHPPERAMKGQVTVEAEALACHDLKRADVDEDRTAIGSAFPAEVNRSRV
jgi:hypothetical protein